MTNPIRDRIKELRRVPAAELMPNAANWRTHPEGQRAALRAVLEQIGFAGAVVAYENAEGRLIIIDGHLRQDEMQGQTVPVLVLDVNEEEARVLLASFDPLGAMAEADAEKLAELLAGMDTASDAVRTMLDDLAAQTGLDLEGDAVADAVDLGDDTADAMNGDDGGDLCACPKCGFQWRGT